MDTTDEFSPYRADGKLYGFVCVVTGASHPLGEAVVMELAAHGAASIYACDSATRSPQTSAALVARVAAAFPKTRVIAYPVDVAREDETLVLIDEALNALGRLDVWVCAPGVGSRSGQGSPSTTSLADTTPADLQASFAAHALAPFFALKYAPPAMAKLAPAARSSYYPNAAPKHQPYGSIVVVGSIAAPPAAGPAYTMAAHAALGVVRAAVPQLQGTGVRMNHVSVGCVGEEPGTTPRTAGTAPGSPPLGRPQEAARVVGFLASGFSSFVSGANLVVDGGASGMNPLVTPM